MTMMVMVGGWQCRAGVVGLAQNSDGSLLPLSQSALTAPWPLLRAKQKRQEKKNSHCFEQNRKERTERGIWVLLDSSCFRIIQQCLRISFNNVDLGERTLLSGATKPTLITFTQQKTSILWQGQSVSNIKFITQRKSSAAHNAHIAQYLFLATKQGGKLHHHHTFTYCDIIQHIFIPSRSIQTLN